MRTYREEASVDPADRPTWVDGVDNPYLHGPYTPVISEITAVDLRVTAGEIPADLCGAYMRNGPNPVLEPKGQYHWFDGDGMVHAVYFRDGRASYIRRWVRTQRAARRDRAGPGDAVGHHGPVRSAARQRRRARHESRTTCKDTGNTTLTWHNGRVLAQWYNAGRTYALDPLTLDTVADETFGGAVDGDVERARQVRSAHRRADRLRLRRFQVVSHVLRRRRRRQAEAQDAHRSARAAAAARHDDHAAVHDPARLPAVPRRRRAAPHRSSRRRVPSRHPVALRRDSALRHAGADQVVRVRARLRAAHGERVGGGRLDHDGRLLPARSDDPPRSDRRSARLDARVPALSRSPAPLAHEHAHRREARAAARRCSTSSSVCRTRSCTA